MANIHKFTENIKSDVAMDIATLTSGNKNTEEYFSMANYDLAVFLILTGDMTAGTTLTVQMRQQIGAGGIEDDLGDSISLDGDDDNKVNVIQVRGEELDVDAGNDRVGILCTAASQNAEVGVILLRMRARYKQASLP